MHGVERTVDRVRATGEIFTPSSLVIEILQYVSIELLAPSKSVLDPACGDGQFLTAAKWVKVLHFGMAEDEALKEIFGVDIMRDNVDLCRRRLGGGTIVHGNALDPHRRLPDQSDEEHELMKRLFDAPTRSARKKVRLVKPA
jgi:type I restriction-modification system DNA methylase subunit